ncbi:hypothetical protein INS49_004461 [Diaporthe citri]|uniref:uncharacterized protein n=1 Tax=Diaporthe citri TaxID=83186 RepID=UPI001C7F5B2F|nr:uncharacterized protein INS49_004461 [Diaporthe citri]KAG6354444.1 hypothetical protein INS49_004461 [Diaporthe citri]
MCILETKDLLCSTQGCPNIIEYQGHEKRRKCPFVEAEQEFGSCGRRDQVKVPGSERSKKHKPCGDCARKKADDDANYYRDVAEHLTKSLQDQWNRDDERRRKKKEQETALVTGAGTGYSDGQGGHPHEPSGVYLDPGMDLSAMPQELDLDDFGEGPSHGHVQGHNQRGDEGHYRQDGQGSGGWSQQ